MAGRVIETVILGDKMSRYMEREREREKEEEEGNLKKSTWEHST